MPVLDLLYITLTRRLKVAQRVDTHWHATGAKYWFFGCTEVTLGGGGGQSGRWVHRVPQSRHPEPQVSRLCVPKYNHQRLNHASVAIIWYCEKTNEVEQRSFCLKISTCGNYILNWHVLFIQYSPQTDCIRRIKTSRIFWLSVSREFCWPHRRWIMWG